MKKYFICSLIAMFLFFSASRLLYAETEGRPADQMLEYSPRDTTRIAVFIRDIITSMVFGLIGILLAIIGYKLFDIVTPFSLAKELAEDQNIAVGIVVGSIIIGICIVVSKAIM